MSLIRDYSLLVKKAYEEQNTLLFTQLFHFTDNDPSVLAICAELNSMPDKAITDSVDSLLEDTSYALAVAVNNYLRLIRSLSTGDPREVFEAFALFYTSFIPLFNVSETCYQVPVIKNLSSLLVQLALRADQTGLKGKAQKAHTAARLLSKTFNIMLADRSPIEVSKRQGLFHITNLAFKMYFRLNTIKLCQTFISNIGKGNVELEMFPMSQQVTYQYYLGRYYLLDGDFPKASECLYFSFRKCPVTHYHNKRVILHYLIPARMMIGLMPSHQLLYQYNLVGPYDGLVTCLIQGDIEGYLSNLETHFHYFYQHFTYLLLKERGIVLVWRCLMRNLSIQKKKMGVNMPILSFHDCLIAFRYSSKDESIGLDDVICLLVSLVSQNYIKGYLDLKKSRLVLSKINAFPSVDRVRVYREVYNENSVETYLYESQPDPPADIERLMEE